MKSAEVEYVLWKCPFCTARRRCTKSQAAKRRTCGNRLCRQAYHKQNHQDGVAKPGLRRLQVTDLGWAHEGMDIDRRLDVELTKEGWAV